MKNQKKSLKKKSKPTLLTVEQHLRKNLSGDKLSLALINTIPTRRKIKVEHFSDAIFQAFQFGETPQGFEYWNEIFQEALRKKNAN